MATIAYQASHEQFSPSELVKLAVRAEKSGFDAVHSSDHFHPWSERQGQSGFSFAWLGAAMQATTIPFGLICAPGQRYHPAVVAQAIATLCEMFPQRFWVSLGSGEALNENITGEGWPDKKERNLRLLESANIIRQLLKGEEVTVRGRVNVQEARLYTLPSEVPKIMGAAVSAATAEWMGGWADGLLTVHRPLKDLREVVNAFHQGGGKGKPMFLKVQLSYARNLDAARAGAYDQWRTNILSPDLLNNLSTVKQFDAAAEYVRPEDLDKMVHMVDKVQDFSEQLKTYIDLGFETIILHNVNREQENFISDFGEQLLPSLRVGSLKSQYQLI